jgi:dUTP pyrophosphatase
MKIKIKKIHKDAVIPAYAKPGDAGMDLTAVKADTNSLWDYITYHTGLSIEIPEGYVGLLFPRSSVYKSEQTLTNSVGVIDSGYRGEIMLKYTKGSAIRKTSYKSGDRVGQLIILPYPKVEFEEVDHLSDTERGSGGYGSTGT